MPTNTTDVYVPMLDRHVYTAGGCSNGSHNQPQFNESRGAFTETWEGYILVPQSIDNVKLKVSADDNACFYLHAFPDKKANLPGRGAFGGGTYASAESDPIDHLEKGYYRATVTYENINYPGANVARLEVLLNGAQITIGQLETHNLITKLQAETLLGNYAPVNYSYMPHPAQVWSHVGGDYFDAYNEEVQRFTTDGVYDEEAHSENGDWYNSCALRVSVALAQYGINLSDAQVTGMRGDATVLPPEGYAIVSASGMTAYFSTLFGVNSDFNERNNYLFLNPGNDIICFGGRHVNNGANHVGFCQGTDGASAGEITEKVWILYRPTWGPPVNSPLD